MRRLLPWGEPCRVCGVCVSNKPRIVVGLSGGVDSTLAASMLLEQNYEVVGVTLRLLPCEDSGERRSCCGLDGVAQARAVAGQLGIRHYVADCHDAFTDNVLKQSWNVYAQGMTPNPCVLCNRHIKFGWLLDFAKTLGAEQVATGHYAQMIPDATGHRRLHRGADHKKDQSYFLYALDQYQLDAAIMPLGGMTKPRVRELAAERGFVNAHRQDSQDVCFAVDNGGFPEFMRQRFGATSKPGVLVDDAGKILAQHDGIHKFTLGQRKGIGVALGKPAFVKSVNLQTGAVVLSTEKADLLSDHTFVRNLIWHGEPLQQGQEVECEVQTRHGQKAVSCIIRQENSDMISVRLSEALFAITPGQAAVFYQGSLVLGGGSIVGTL